MGQGKTEAGSDRHSQEPVHSYDQRDVFSRQADRREHNDHRDQTRLRDASSPNTSCCRCDTANGERENTEGQEEEGRNEEERNGTTEEKGQFPRAP